MITQPPVALAIATYLGIGTLAFLVCVWITARQGNPLIERSADLLVNILVAACLIPLLPLVIVGAPFFALLAFCFDALNLRPIRLRSRKPSKGRPPPGVLPCLCRCSTTPAFHGDPGELPAFLRRQISPRPPERGR